MEFRTDYLLCGTDELAKKEIAEKEWELFRQKYEEMEQTLENLEKSYQENITQLEKKMEQERENVLREMDRMLEYKMEVSFVVE